MPFLFCLLAMSVVRILSSAPGIDLSRKTLKHCLTARLFAIGTRWAEFFYEMLGIDANKAAINRTLAVVQLSKLEKERTNPDVVLGHVLHR